MIIALFNNVYRKSEASERTRMNIANYAYFDNSPVPIGTDCAPKEDEVRSILHNSSGYIDYIGAVMFKISFSGDDIDACNYNKEHSTGTSEILTAESCILELRKDIESEEAAKKDAVSTSAGMKF